MWLFTPGDSSLGPVLFLCVASGENGQENLTGYNSSFVAMMSSVSTWMGPTLIQRPLPWTWGLRVSLSLASGIPALAAISRLKNSGWNIRLSSLYGISWIHGKLFFLFLFALLNGGTTGCSQFGSLSFPLSGNFFLYSVRNKGIIQNSSIDVRWGVIYPSPKLSQQLGFHKEHPPALLSSWKGGRGKW